MSDCMNTEVRDALPDLVHGRLDQLNTATMKAHVESCADCRAELALLKAVRESAPLVPPLNLERMSAAIGNYGGAPVLSHAPARHTPRRGLTYGLMATLAAVVFVIGGIAVNNRGDVQSVASSSNVASQATIGGSVAGSTESAGISESPAGVTKDVQPLVKPAEETQVASLSFVGGTQDLSETELETLLSELDTMESMPAAEPQAVITTIEDIDGGA